jgi:hypothetical protein
MRIEKHNILYHRRRMLPFLKRLEGKKQLCIYFSPILVFSIFDLFIIPKKNLDRLYERI